MSDPKIRAGGSEEGLAFWREMNVKFPHGYRWFQGDLGITVVANHPDIMRAVMKGRGRLETTARILTGRYRQLNKYETTYVEVVLF